jgi:pyruvate/2-oxoacid:ferredoxin oxidoreductase beta subunit
MGAKTKTTPFGKAERKKNLMKIVEAHGNVYATTASPAYPKDLQKKMRKAIAAGKPAFLHIHSPCPSGWEYESEKGIAVARAAVQTNFFPLYEYDDGVVTVKKQKKVKPIETYLNMQGRFQHLTEQKIAQIQKNVDQEFEELCKREEITNRK